MCVSEFFYYFDKILLYKTFKNFIFNFPGAILFFNLYSIIDSF